MFMVSLKLKPPSREVGPGRRKPEVRVDPKDEVRQGGDRPSRGRQGWSQGARDGRELDRYI